MLAARTIFVLTIVTLLSAIRVHAAEPAGAPSEATKKHAQELFMRGLSLSKENRWRDALDAFEQSDRLYRHPRTVFNIGYCERGLGHFTRARDGFRQALAMDAKTPDEAELSAPVRDAAARYLREASQRIGQLRLSLPQADVALSIDGRPVKAGEGAAVAGLRDPGPPERIVGRSLIVEADVGHHVVVIVVSGRRIQKDVQLVAGRAASLSVALPADDEGVDDGGPPDEQTAPADDTLQLVGAGGLAFIGVAGIVSGVVLGVRALDLNDDAVAACPDATRCPDDQAYALANDARSHGNLATTAFVVGGAGIICAGLLLLTSPSLGIGDAVALSPYGPGLSAHGRF